MAMSLELPMAAYISGGTKLESEESGKRRKSLNREEKSEISGQRFGLYEQWKLAYRAHFPGEGLPAGRTQYPANLVALINYGGGTMLNLHVLLLLLLLPGECTGWQW